jgi:hypothetical protein
MPELGRLRYGNQELKASLGHIAGSCFKNKNKSEGWVFQAAGTESTKALGHRSLFACLFVCLFV